MFFKDEPFDHGAKQNEAGINIEHKTLGEKEDHDI
jgi:hypothetical protein